MACRFKDFATIPVVPEPPKGSKTTPLSNLSVLQLQSFSKPINSDDW